MSGTQQHERTRELGELFVSVTGDEAVTERQEGGGQKQAADGDEVTVDDDDGLDDAIDADLDSKRN